MSYPLTTSHLTSYPIFNDAINSIPSSLQNASKKLYSFVPAPPSFAKPYLDRADQIGHKSLGKVDEKFPVLQKPSKEVTQKPVAIVQSTVDTYTTAAKSTFENRVYTPIASSPVYKQRVDPILVPVLDKTEQLVNYFLPPPKTEVSPSHQNQLDRAGYLSKATVSRFIPVAKSTLSKPGEYVSGANTKVHGAINGAKDTTSSYTGYATGKVTEVKDTAIKIYQSQPKDDFIVVKAGKTYIELTKRAIGLAVPYIQGKRDDATDKVNGTIDSSKATLNQLSTDGKAKATDAKSKAESTASDAKSQAKTQANKAKKQAS